MVACVKSPTYLPTPPSPFRGEGSPCAPSPTSISRNDLYESSLPELAFYTEDGTSEIFLYDFGPTPVDDPAEVVIRLVNTGGSVLEISLAEIIEDIGDEFSIIDGPDDLTLEPDVYTFVTLRYSPITPIEV